MILRKSLVYLFCMENKWLHHHPMKRHVTCCNRQTGGVKQLWKICMRTKVFVKSIARFLRCAGKKRYERCVMGVSTKHYLFLSQYHCFIFNQYILHVYQWLFICRGFGLSHRWSNSQQSLDLFKLAWLMHMSLHNKSHVMDNVTYINWMWQVIFSICIHIYETHLIELCTDNAY